MENLVLTNQKVPSIKRSLIDGISIASGSRSTATYYHSKDEQNKAIKEAVDRLYNQSKELPLIIANQNGVTAKFIRDVLLNEFSKTVNNGSCNIVNPIDWVDNGISDKAILGALYNLNGNGISHVLRLFSEIADSKINNERTRKILLGYIWGHPNIEFNFLKYRNKISKSLKHIYGVSKTSVLLSIAEKYLNNGGVYSSEKDHSISDELIGRYSPSDTAKAYKLLLFLFRKGSSDYYSTSEFPFISEYYVATRDITATSKIPEEILIGLISNKNHPQYDRLWSTDIKRESTKKLIRENVTVTSTNQQVRQTKSNRKLGVQKTVNMEKVTDFMALYKTGYETSFTPEIINAIDKLALKDKISDFPYRNIGIVLDTSASMKGHKQESKNTPRAIGEYTSKVLKHSAPDSKLLLTEGETTDLASAFLQLMKSEGENEFDAIFFITDGYENQYEGLTNEVVNAFLTETGRYMPIFQISPITGAETGADVRSLGTEIVKMAVNSPKSLMGQINARLLEVDPKIWIENQVKLLEGSTHSRYARNNVNV